METIRKNSAFERWLVVGGSWGATLALAYAQTHPQRVSGIVLRATFLGTRTELDSAFLKTLPLFYPALYDDFLGVLPADERAPAAGVPIGGEFSMPILRYTARPRAPGVGPSASCPNTCRTARGSIRKRCARAAPCHRRHSWKRIILPMTASWRRIS